jgi:hypothetical protein
MRIETSMAVFVAALIMKPGRVQAQGQRASRNYGCARNGTITGK